METKRQTKRQRQLINRAAGFTGSFMPIEQAQAFARKMGKSPLDTGLVEKIRVANQQTKRKLKASV